MAKRRDWLTKRESRAYVDGVNKKGEYYTAEAWRPIRDRGLQRDYGASYRIRGRRGVRQRARDGRIREREYQEWLHSQQPTGGETTNS